MRLGNELQSQDAVLVSENGTMTIAKVQPINRIEYGLIFNIADHLLRPN